MSRHHLFIRVPSVLFLVLAVCAPAQATWSIVLADKETGEVAVGTATCLENYDPLARIPVIAVGHGAAAVQAAGDLDGTRRQLLFEEIKNGTDPREILQKLDRLPGTHDGRQYGIADTQGRRATFTGKLNRDWAGGLVGSQGSLVYAIQGNLLMGECVVRATETAILEATGDIPRMLLSGMRAARESGGDGRCSCDLNNPSTCSCPIAESAKSSHVATMIVARIGDEDDDNCDRSGCADGDYFMRFNVPFQEESREDPVSQLTSRFSDWRNGHVGRPDAIQSEVVLEGLPQSDDDLFMHIVLKDWRGLLITKAMESVVIEHADDSAGMADIGPLERSGRGRYSVVLSNLDPEGKDQLRVVVDDGFRPVTLMPDVEVRGPVVPVSARPLWPLAVILVLGVGLIARKAF